MIEIRGGGGGDGRAPQWSSLGKDGHPTWYLLCRCLHWVDTCCVFNTRSECEVGCAYACAAAMCVRVRVHIHVCVSPWLLWTPWGPPLFGCLAADNARGFLLSSPAPGTQAQPPLCCLLLATSTAVGGTGPHAVARGAAGCCSPEQEPDEAGGAPTPSLRGVPHRVWAVVHLWPTNERMLPRGGRDLELASHLHIWHPRPPGPSAWVPCSPARVGGAPSLTTRGSWDP